MSRNSKAPRQKRKQRIERTREVLGDALVGLIHEKPFEEITVQDVLDRAGVGRSTFYVHFRDKNDLFLTDVDEFFEQMATLLQRREDSSNRVAPVRELFAHLADVRTFYSALVASGRIHDVLELAQGNLARGIAQRLDDRFQASRIPAEQRTAIAQAFAGALLSMLTWWIDHGTPGSPEQMDELYHSLVWAGIGDEPPGGALALGWSRAGW